MGILTLRQPCILFTFNKNFVGKYGKNDNNSITVFCCGDTSAETQTVIITEETSETGSADNTQYILWHKKKEPLKSLRFQGFIVGAAVPHLQSRILPSQEIVTTCQGLNLPLALRAFSAAFCSPPQQGTSIRTMVTLLISLSRMMAVSFSE